MQQSRLAYVALELDWICGLERRLSWNEGRQRKEKKKRSSLPLSPISAFAGRSGRSLDLLDSADHSRRLTGTSAGVGVPGSHLKSTHSYISPWTTCQNGYGIDLAYSFLSSCTVRFPRPLRADYYCKRALKADSIASRRLTLAREFPVSPLYKSVCVHLLRESCTGSTDR